MSPAGIARQPRAAGPAPAGFADRLASRLDAMPCAEVEECLDATGCAILPDLIAAEDCERLVPFYARDGLFRSRIVMGALAAVAAIFSIALGTLSLLDRGDVLPGLLI